METVIKIAVLLSVIFAAIPCAADDLFFDADFKAYEEAFYGENQACWKGSKVMKEITECEARVKAKYGQDTRARGTERYCQKAYGSLSLEALKTRLDELTVLRNEAREFGFLEKRPYGVLDKPVFNAEMTFIKNRINEIELEAYCESQRAQLKELGMSEDRLPPVCKKYYRLQEARQRLHHGDES